MKFDAKYLECFHNFSKIMRWKKEVPSLEQFLKCQQYPLSQPQKTPNTLVFGDFGDKIKTGHLPFLYFTFELFSMLQSRHRGLKTYFLPVAIFLSTFVNCILWVAHVAFPNEDISALKHTSYSDCQVFLLLYFCISLIVFCESWWRHLCVEANFLLWSPCRCLASPPLTVDSSTTLLLPPLTVVLLLLRPL